MKPEITSHRNERAKLLKRLVRDAGERRRAGTCVVEGVRVASDVLETVAIRFAFVSPRLEALAGGPELLARLRDRLPAEDLLLATDGVLGSVSDTRAPQGVLLAVERPDTGGFPSEGPVLAAWEVQDPGNVGTLVRTAEASGCASVLLARAPGGQAADPFSPRAVRASAGSAFRLPVHEWTGEAAELAVLLERAGLAVAACVARGGLPPDEVALGRAVILVGAESRGLPDALCAGATLVTIPLRSSVESLNAASAAAVVAFESARQRRMTGKGVGGH